MSSQTKIATCCYCGNRSAISLSEISKHNLNCESCGAPVTELSYLPAPEKAKKSKDKDVKYEQKSRDRDDEKPKKKKKSFGRWLLGEIKDEIEDFFD